MSLFLRQLARRGKDITLDSRKEKFINGRTKEVFTPLTPPDDRALVKTLTGITVFDETNIETIATHELRLVWRDDVGAEQWVTLKGNRLKILTAENCCENDNVLVLMCTERGEDSKVVNRA